MTRVTRVVGPAALVVVGFLALLAALAYGGGAAAPLLADPGALVRWGLPVAKFLVDLSAAGMIGALILVCFALSPKFKEFDAALDVAAGSAAVCAVASAITGYLTFLAVTGLTPSGDPTFSDALTAFIVGIPLGQAWLATTLIAAAVTVLCFAVRDPRALAFVTGFAMLALLPMALQGHAAGTAGHDQAVNGLGLHLVFVCIWLGGLLTIVLLRKVLDGPRLLPIITRYSTLAIVCFIVVAVSGYVSAELRIGTLTNLATAYGVLVLVKVAALVVLGLFGMAQRRVLIERLERGIRGSYWWIIVTELAFMGIATGVGTALARTATPIKQELGSRPSPAELLSGEPLPPAPGPWTWVTTWDIDILWLLGCAFAIFFYLAGVRRLRRRGDHWPVARTISWVAGMVALFYITNGGINAYEKYLFSVHMLAHMVLTMMVPVLLVPGAPVTLAARAIRKRKDGSRGTREWILWAVHTPFANLITRPIVAAVLFAGSLWVFYFTPILRWAMADHLGHEWMIAHFVITGYLFVQSLIGIDPVKHRLSYPLRLALLLGTMAFHAFFGLAIMTGTGLLAADWFGAMGRTWGADPLADQKVGGGIAWSVGEIPTLALALVVAIQWSRADAKEAKRRDRTADRTGEAELREYNARLARMAERDRV